MCDSNVDYKQMYLNMMRAAEAAIDLLTKAQKECEELYISAEPDSSLTEGTTET